MDLFLGHRPVLHSFGYHEHLARPQIDLAISQFNRQMALKHEKEVVRIVMLVPNELSLGLDDHDIVSVELRHGSRLPVLRERCQLRFQVDLAHFVKA